MRGCVYILLLCVGFLHAQGDFRITRQYTQQHGLSNSAIYALCEDSNGFLWTATQEGLNRFDGLHFKTWYHNKRDSISLAHNSVNDILEYKHGMLLIATANGLSVFNTRIGKFENQLIAYSQHKPGAGANVTSFYLDTDSLIWVNQNGHFDIIDQQLQFQNRYSDQRWAHALQGSTVNFEKWYKDKQGRIWLATDTSGIQIIDVENKIVFHRYHNPYRWPFMQFQHIRAFYFDEQQQAVFVAPWGAGIYRIDLSDNTMLHQNFHQPLLEASSVNSILKLDNGNLLCNSNGLFFEVDPATLQIELLDMGWAAQADKERCNAITMIRAAENRIWVAAHQGLFQLENDHQQLEIAVASLTGQANCLDVIVTLAGAIYALYDNYQLITVSDSLGTYSAHSIAHQSGDFTTQLSEDASGHLWIGTSHGVRWFDLMKKQFVPVPSALIELQHRFVHSIYTDRDSLTWIGTRQPFGLWRYDHKLNALERIDNPSLQAMGSVSEYARISSIIEDPSGSLWMRSIAGGPIVQYKKGNQSWHAYPESPIALPLLSNKGLYALFPDAEGNLWLSTTLGDGLIRYDYQTNQLQQFNREDGLLSDYIYQVEYFRNHLYLTSTYGFTKFNLRTHKAVTTNWTNVDGEFKVAIDTTREKMVVGMKGKIIFIDLEEQLTGIARPVPIVDEIVVNNEQLYIDPSRTSLRLAADQKNIAIAFTSAFFDGAEKLNFAYQLLGADQDWQSAQEARVAQYAALSPGEYVFQLKVADPQGEWSEVVDALTFTIVPPVWQRAWFIGLIALTIGSVVFLLLRRRVKTMQHESSLKQKVAETEMMALRAQMNPHFIFNSINSIDALIMNDDKYQATVYLNKFAKLIRNILDSSKQNTVPIEKDIETLRLYIELEQFRSENAFTSTIDIDPSLREKDTRVPPLIIQPYVENAILHGLKNRQDDLGELLITVRRSDEGIHYSITDNGVGRAAAKHGMTNGKTSYGMQMSSDRIMIFNQEKHASVRITDLTEAGKPTGTKVEINLKTA